MGGRMVFVFGSGFELDVAAGELRHQGETIPLQPKVFDTLRYLVENRDRVVGKQELIEALWGGESLNPIAIPWSVSHARKALLKHGGPRDSIKTVRGEGYRFTAEARRVTTASASVRPAPQNGASFAPSAAPSFASEPFVGRDDAMDRLQVALNEARAGSGRLVLLVGEAGMGKTTCARELTGSVQRSGMRVWAGRAVGDGAPAFWPWIQILRDACADRRLVGVERRAFETLMAKLVPEGLPPTMPARSPGPALADSSRFWLSEALAQALRQSAEQKLRVLLFEDLHDADDGSLEALALLAPKLAQARMLVVATARPGFLDSPRQTGAMRLRPGETLTLSGLTLADTDRYIAAVLGQAPPAETVDAVHAGSEGNPLFLKEAVRLLATRSHGPMGALELRLPDVVRQLVHQRIATLDHPTRELLAGASVLGNDFELSVLARIFTLPVDDLAARIDAAERARFLERAADDGAYTFAHALLRDAFYERLPTVDRRRLHAKAARALQSLAVVRPRLGAIAHHFHRALPEADADEASRACRLAGDAAMDLFGYDEAAQFYAWALEARGYGAQPPDPRTACELLLSAALASRRASHVRATRAACRRAVEIARGARFADVLLEAGRILRPTVWIAHVPDPLALDAVEQALPLLPPAGRARACALLAFLPPHSLSVERSRALSDEAVRTARELGDRSLLLEALASSFHALSGPDRIDELLAVADEVLQLDGPAVSWWSAEAFFARHHSLLQRGDAAGAERALRAFGACADRLRMPEAIWQHDRVRAQQLLCTGEYELAETRFHELFARASSFRTYGLFQYAAQMNALSWERDGRSLAAAGLANPDVAWKWAASLPVYRVEYVLSLIDGGDRAAALAEFNLLAVDGFAAVTRDMSYLYVLSRLATAAVRLEQRAAARRLYAELLPYAGHVTVNSLSISLGAVSHFLGVLAAFLGDPAAVEHFRASVLQNGRIGHTAHARRSEKALAGVPS
jgi:DNA-binding winged helix-turn-helix (wHTH) protein/type II secretory pathway predicted ATPase ExeA